MYNPQSMDWHAQETTAVLAALGSREKGLDQADAERRLARMGPNRLTPPTPRSPLRRFAAQFDNLLIYVLLVACAVTLVLGHTVDAGVIFGVVVVNALIGFIQEGKAERALDAVRGLISLQAVVIRDGHRRTVDAATLVPGDVVFLQSGDRVPADLRLLNLRELSIDEAILTGESAPSPKQVDAVPAAAELGDRHSMAYSGTLVTFGQGRGVVASTGDATEIGRISTLLARVEPLSTPLTRQMSRFARVLSVAIVGLAMATGAYGVWVRGYAAGDMFLAAVGLAVAAIPEGLPAIITITLAIGVQRMAGRNAIIRRLPAVETLGSVTVVCSDKTGTLTRNEMTVRTVVTRDRSFDVEGDGYDTHGGISDGCSVVDVEILPPLRELCLAGTLCNDARLLSEAGGNRIDGDPMEGALAVLGHKAGLAPARIAEELPRDDVIPFEANHRFMATLHHDHAGHRCIYVKGAPEVVIDRCSMQRTERGDVALDRDYWLQCLEAIAEKGQRALAIATRAVSPGKATLCFDDVAGELVMLGLVGIMDPPRSEAIPAVAECRRAGIMVKMITGDHATTATAIAGQMGIGDGGAALTGAQLDTLDDAGLCDRVMNHDVFARASPEHKLRLVQALQAQGQVIAMTGDGVNDAPALKRAGVGIAMGLKGSEVAREAAEMVLADDNFATIVHAVREGRTVYDNIKKSILFILPTNGGEALTILAAVALGLTLPVTAVQILWVNMITAVTLALALAFESAEADLMERRPRDPTEPLLTRFMLWRILFVSLLMVLGTFGLFLWQLDEGADVATARTVAVNALVVAEMFYLVNARFLTAPALTRRGLLGNPYALLAVFSVLLFQLLFTYLPPMQVLFGTVALQWREWLAIGAFGVSLFLAVELEKWAARRVSGRRKRV